MLLYNKLPSYILYFLAFFFVGCSNNSSKNDEPKVNEISTKKEPVVEEKIATIVSLTNEQIETVGITLGNIELKQLTSTIKANGNLKVPNKSKGNITSLYGGVIQKLNIHIGDYVSKGDVVATIANPRFIELQEEYLTTASKITFAEQEFARQQELNDGNAGAKKNLQKAVADLSELKTRRASLQQQIQLMGINPSNVTNSNLKGLLTVKSPISGTVCNVIAKIGSYVDVASPVAEIIDNAFIHLDLDIFEKDLPYLKVGQIIHFTLTNNPVTEYDAVVYSIGKTFENDSKTVSVHCNVNGNKTGLIDGMNITAIVSLNKATTPTVANDAIVEADGKYYIFVVTNKKQEEEHHEHEKDEKDTQNVKDETRKLTKQQSTNFQKIEVLKGIANMGYTAITFLNDIPQNSKIVTKGAFFINAKLNNAGNDHHEH